jgi:hypothetical protein
LEWGWYRPVWTWRQKVDLIRVYLWALSAVSTAVWFVSSAGHATAHDYKVLGILIAVTVGLSMGPEPRFPGDK